MKTRISHCLKGTEYLSYTLYNKGEDITQASTPFKYPDDEFYKDAYDSNTTKQNMFDSIMKYMSMFDKRNIQIICSLLLNPYTKQSDLARELGISRQAVNERLMRIRYKAPVLYFRMMKKDYLSIIKECNSKKSRRRHDALQKGTSRG